MKIYLGTDHAGFALKEIVKAYLTTRDDVSDVADFGALSFERGDDYPDFIRPVAEAVAEDWRNGNTKSRGIVFGGSGQGEAMVANRVKGVRATVYYGGAEEILTLSREHNDANILSLGARFIAQEEVEHIVDIWLRTPFSKEAHHLRRIKKIEQR